MFASNTSQVSSDATYIEDVFSTYLYTGNGSTQTITNGIDLAGKGGLVWLKSRSIIEWHNLYDTARGASFSLATNAVDFQYDLAGNGVSAFGSTGFTITGGNTQYNSTNDTFASWTFRKQPKFFDVVTYTGDGTGTRNIAHALGSVPGCMINKLVSNTSNWQVYHRANTTPNANPESNTLRLNLTNASASSTAWINAPTATQFTVGSSLNTSGETYVVYLFAHNAGGFGLTGTDNVISCGSYTGNDTSGVTVNLGYEPQWLLIKNATTGNSNAGWYIQDNMRGLPVPPSLSLTRLQANTSGAEETSASSSGVPQITATGFNLSPNGSTGYNNSGDTYIYIAIRRGPMKTPTSGTSVFAPVTYAGNNAARSLTSGFPVDLEIVPIRGGGQTWSPPWLSRLTGNGRYLVSSSTAAEDDWSSFLTNEFQSNTGVNRVGIYLNSGGQNLETWMFQRAPGFFDEVCYTGTGSARTVTHNLGVAPEMMILKTRTGSSSEWPVYAAPLGATQGLYLGPYADPAITTSGYWNNTSPTSSVFTVGNASASNFNGGNFVAYLFASCPGVSKVGSYTGNGSSQAINCGFTGGARFVLIKRTDSTGDWYIWDTARGIVSANDPRLSLNSTAAEVTTDDSIDPDNSGFIVNQVSATNINVSSATYIYLAIA